MSQDPCIIWSWFNLCFISFFHFWDLCESAFYRVLSFTFKFSAQSLYLRWFTTLCALYLINCRPNRHNLHHILCLLHTEYLEQLIILGSCLQHYNITKLIIFKVIINKVPRKSFRPVIPLLDQSSIIHTFRFDIYDYFIKKNSLSKFTALPDTKIGLHILNIKLTILPNSFDYFWPSCWGKYLHFTIWALQKI